MSACPASPGIITNKTAQSNLKTGCMAEGHTRGSYLHPN